ncbi:hypothetical protein KSW81_002419 [Nannochloris sp. 'desiccata']|nr:hypothetical protein KSW81_002419 [Chlorella desiccata (nom. nud.)]
MAEAISQHLEGLAKELSCISESVRHSAKCPVCKTKATRRDIAEDPTMDRVVKAFRNLQDHKEDLIAGGLPAAPAIPWLQGVDDEDFRSLSRSLSGTALENLRVNKRGRSKSPATVHKPSTAAAATAAAVAAGEVDKKENTEKPRSRKRSDASASQGIQKFFKKDATGNKIPAPHTTSTGGDAAEDAEIADEHVAESPTASDSRMRGNAGADDAARQLDDIVAGLDSAEPTPSEQQGPPAAPAAAVPAAAVFDVGGVNSGKENQKNGVRRNTMQKKPAGGAAALSKEEHEQEAPDSSGPRRIPTRLVPWNCSLCTFENKGGEIKCQMCQTVKGAETPPPAQQNFPAVADAWPAAPAAATAGHLATTTGGKTAVNRSSKKRTTTAAAATHANGSSEAPAPEKQQQQRKMTGVKQTGARGRTITTTAQREKHTLPVTTTTTEDINVGGWTGGVASTKWVLLGSGLDSLGKEQLRLLGALSGATIADKWTPRVTHVICGAGGANAAYPGEKTARRTFKYLMGVLHGRWVLTQEWVNATLSTKTKVDESAYQIEKDGVGCACGAAVSRAAAITGCDGNKNAAASPLLLRGFEVQLQGEFANKAQIIELVKAAGGKVVSRLPTTGANTSTSVIKKKSKKVAQGGGVVLVEVPDTSEAVAAGFKAAIVSQTWFAKAVETGVPVASHRWLTDSISTFQLSPLDQSFLIGSS